MRKLKKGECSEYFMNYANLVPQGKLINLLKSTHKDTQSFLKDTGEINGNYRYAPGKWTLKEVLIHLIDTEHIMGCRALRIARKDQTPLPAFEQNDFVAAVDVSERTIEDLLEEFSAMRKLTTVMFKHFTEEMMDRSGTVSGKKMSVLALAYVILGHEIHHLNVIRERYLG